MKKLPGEGSNHLWPLPTKMDEGGEREDGKSVSCIAADVRSPHSNEPEEA